MSLLDFFRGDKQPISSALTEDDILASVSKSVTPYHEPSRASAINSAMAAMNWAVDNNNAMPVNTADDAGGTYGISTSLSLEVVNWYAHQTFIGWQACSIMSTHWLVGRACSMPIDDAIKNGWEITSRKKDTSISDDIAAILCDSEKKHDLKRKLHNFGFFGRVFGVRVAIFRIDGYGSEEYGKPLNFDDISSDRKYKGIALVDPQYCTPVITNSSNPIADDFMKVTYWQVGGIRYHHSFCVEYIHTPVSQTMKGVYMNAGGISLVQELYEKVYLAEQAANEANRLLFSKRVWVRSGDVESALLDQNAFEQKMGFFARAINNFGTLLLGENETLNKHETSLQEVTGVIGQKFEHCCAVSGVPSNRLMMTQLTGFAASGEAEEKIYMDLVGRLQSNLLTPVVDMHTRLTLLSHDIADDDYEITFNPATSFTANELADINLKKSQTDTALAGIQAISPEAIAEKWAKDPHGGFAGIDLADYAIQEQDDFNDGMAGFGGSETDTQDGEADGKRWITTESGSHVQLDGDGNVIAGMGGKFNGQNIKDVGGTKNFTKYETNAEREQAKQPTPEAKPSPENESSNSLTMRDNTAKLSSTSQTEAANGDKTMSANISELTQKHGKEWTSPDGVKRMYFNGQDGIDFLTNLSENSEMPMPVPQSMGKSKLFQLKNGAFATDDGKIANVLRGAGLETIRSDKDFAKIKAIEKPTASEKKERAKKAVESEKAAEASKSPVQKLSDKINALHERMQAHKKTHGMDDEFKSMSSEKSKLVKDRDAMEESEAKPSPENESSNSLTKSENDSAISSTSQVEAANGDKTMSDVFKNADRGLIFHSPVNDANGNEIGVRGTMNIKLVNSEGNTDRKPINFAINKAGIWKISISPGSGAKDLVVKGDAGDYEAAKQQALEAVGGIAKEYKERYRTDSRVKRMDYKIDGYIV